MCFEKRLVARNVSPLRPLSRHVHAYIYIFAKKFFEETRNPDEPSIGYPNGRYLTESKKLFPTRQNHSARSARKFIYGREKGKNAWRTIGEYRRAVIRAYSETWEGGREKKNSRKRGTGSMEVSGERSTRKLSGIQSGSLLASERQRDARTENKVAAAIGLAPLLHLLLLLSRPPRLSLDPTHGGGLLFLNLRRSRNARVAAVFS